MADSVVPCLQVLEEAHVAVGGDGRRSLVESIEVDAGEERVLLELLEGQIAAFFADAEPISRVKLEQLVDNVDDFGLELVWNHELTLFDLLEHFEVDSAVEGRLADTHLVDHAPKSPQVHTR